MAKEKTVYVCTNCGQDSPKWVGKCPSCGAWNTYVEEIIRKEPANKRPVSGLESVKSKPVTLNDITGGDEPRIDMHDEELNRVLGGGLVPGSLVLLGGEPGIANPLWCCKPYFICLTKKYCIYREKRVPGN